MLGHPALVAGHRRSDPEREALLAEQRVATVARAIAPDLTGFGKVNDVFFLVGRPRDVLLPLGQWRADGVQARDDALKIAIDELEDFFADARHDAHVDDGVGRVGKLDADL